MLGEPPHAWVVLLFWTLLRATGGFSSYGYIQTEDYKTKYLKDLATVEDGNEKQLISDLHQVLERLQSIQFPALRKKHGYLPVCEPGEQCALRKDSYSREIPRTCCGLMSRS
uniref:Cocaine- and amphetamine-regulated transcript protein n=1 Tax=Oryzias latipes TaxID=8090 RepID=A0A3P9KID9_ORYLA